MEGKLREISIKLARREMKAAKCNGNIEQYILEMLAQGWI